MTAPAPVERIASSGIPLMRGYQTLVTLTDDPNVSFWERSVKPPSFDGGEAIDFTTMHNTTYRTKSPQGLIDNGDITGVATYDPLVFDEIVAVINVNGEITVTFADGSTLAFWGFLRIFDPQSIEISADPTANFTITVSNWDSTAKTEEGYALAEVAGT